MFDYIAIDWGTKKCGFAVGDSVNQLVLVKAVVPYSELSMEVYKMVAAYKDVTHIIVSHNKTFQRTSTTNSDLQEAFGEELKSLYPNIKTVLFSERGTTKKVGKDEDNFSAQELLRLYFEFELK